MDPDDGQVSSASTTERTDDAEILGDLAHGPARVSVQLDGLSPELWRVPRPSHVDSLPGPRAPLSGVHRTGSRPRLSI